jgi:DNA-binding CsgD family transcriptional regulator
MAKTPFDAIDRFVADLDQTGDPLRIQSLLEREVLRLGFERFTYWLLWSSEGPRVPFWLTNYPPEWTAHYNKSDFKSHDIIASHSAVSVRPFLWSDLPRHSLTRAQRAVFDDAIPFGLRAGGNIPLHGPGKARATLTVACDCSDRAFEKLFAARRHELRLVALYTHERIIALGLDRTRADRVKLTPREIDVLAWSAKGKTRRDVGAILGVTEEAVKKHITNACRKLNTSNKMHAAAVAIAHGLVIP